MRAPDLSLINIELGLLYNHTGYTNQVSIDVSHIWDNMLTISSNEFYVSQGIPAFHLHDINVFS